MTKTATPFLRALASTLVGGLGVAVLAAAAPAALAATTQGFQISPPVSEININPGSSIRQTMTVTNLTGSQMTINVGKSNFAAQGEEGEVELTNNADPLYSLAPWFVVSPATVVVPPTASEQVTYTITVPKNAEPGGRYGSVTFNTIPPKLPNGQSGAAVQQQLASLILLRINGAAHEQLKIASFASNKTFYEYGPISFLVRVSNVGNVHERPVGQIVIKNMLGLKTATINVEQQYVLPGAIRRLTAEFNRHFMFGRYTATLTLKNGTIQTLTATTAFTVIPYKLVIIILIIIILIVLFFTKTRKRFARAFRILAGRE
ncbi:MAG TPA: hypothetical protein VMS08_01085 [Candidatus Saccharimonadia bacterium]|nr:hypothetical protein [Candidatus Saccharimonadia bacterium]